MSRLGHLLALVGVLLAAAALCLAVSPWAGAAITAVGALLVLVDGLAEWAARGESAAYAATAADRLDAIAQAVARLESKVETVERRDALGRM